MPLFRVPLYTSNKFWTSILKVEMTEVLYVDDKNTEMRDTV